MADDSDTAPPDGVGGLFSVDAADNAEVVNPDSTVGIDQMWSTGTEGSAIHHDGLLGADDYSAHGTGPANPANRVGPVDPANPVDPWSRVEDPVSSAPFGAAHEGSSDAPEGAWARDAEQTWAGGTDDGGMSDHSNLPQPPGAGTVPPRPPSPPTSQGAFGVGAPGASSSPWTAAPTAPGSPGAGGVFSARPVMRSDDDLDEFDEPEVFDDVQGDASDGSPFSAGADAWGPPTSGSGEGPNDPWDAWRDPDPAGAHSGEARPGVHNEAVVPDSHDFDKAVARLGRDDTERARVPLTVCGALLEPTERVRTVVTGQMLGCPAAVVLTDRRVLVVNERRWRPIVDIYELGDGLQVRGRHDGHVAALSFSDESKLSMVDGIGAVDLAVALAKATRDRAVPGEDRRGDF